MRALTFHNGKVLLFLDQYPITEGECLAGCRYGYINSITKALAISFDVHVSDLNCMSMYGVDTGAITGLIPVA